MVSADAVDQRTQFCAVQLYFKTCNQVMFRRVVCVRPDCAQIGSFIINLISIGKADNYCASPFCLISVSSLLSDLGAVTWRIQNGNGVVTRPGWVRFSSPKNNIEVIGDILDMKTA